jgi:hypothetical protein
MALEEVRQISDAEGLRYPREAIKDYTDYLLINIADYTSVTKAEGRSGSIAVQDRKFNPTKNGGILETKTTNLELTKYGRAIRGKNQLYNKNLKSDYGSIILPIPSNIQDGNSVNFGPGSLDGLTASALEYALGTIGRGAEIKSLSDIGPLITSSLRGGLSLLANDGAIDYFTRNIAASAANIPFGGNLTASQLLARQTGNILNPNMELLFEGVNLRSFKFSFKMTPRDAKEAENVKKIIRTFKKYMSPQADDLYLKTPRIFELTYMKGSKKHPFLHKFKQCVLIDMSVNYTGEGTYATYGGPDNQGGGTPVSMVMDLGFKELEPIYSRDYDNPEGQGGVGF